MSIRKTAANMLERMLSGSVVVRFTLTSSLLIVLACGLLSVVLVRRHLSEIERNLTDRGHTITTFLSREAELGVLSGDRQALEKLASAALVQEDVSWCRFVDLDRKVLAEVGRDHTASPRGTPSANTEVMEFRAPIIVQNAALPPEEIGFAFNRPPRESAGRTIGSVVVGIAVGALKNERRRAFATAIMFTAGVAFVAVLSAIMLTLGPLKALASSTELAAERVRMAEMKSRLVAQASHEFRTPLAVILSTADALKRYWSRMDPTQQQDRLSKIEKSVRHMTDMLEDVIAIGRADQIGVVLQPTDLAQLCREIVADLSAATPTSTQVRYTATGLTGPVMLDPKFMRQIIRNLLSNAIKYSPDCSVVDLAVCREPDAVVVRVRDQGIGISPQDQATLFEPFHRGNNVGRAPGTGLGLAITKRAVTALGGTIAVESVIGEGSTFTVTLPLGDAAANSRRTHAQEDPPLTREPEQIAERGLPSNQGLNRPPQTRAS